MDFYDFIYEVSTFLSLDFEVRWQLVSDFVEKKLGQLPEAISTIERESLASILQFSNEKR